MKVIRPLLVSGLLITGLYGCTQDKNPFVFIENSEGIELTENGKPVFFYQRKPKSPDGRFVCNNYLHPVYNLDGDTLTGEFPEDHIHHRGIFWAWHQLFSDSLNLGDGWIMERISFDVFQMRTSAKSQSALLEVDVNWESSALGNGKPFVIEHSTIEVHPLNEGLRCINFTISLQALIPGVSIGGSDDEKGYGGFSIRMKMPSDLTFTSKNGPVSPQNLQITAGPWMDFSGTFGESGNKSGIILLCHPTTPNYPPPWILRQTGSMQNVVFPGRQRIELRTDEPVVLKYRLVLHRGDATGLDFAKMQADYEALSH